MMNFILKNSNQSKNLMRMSSFMKIFSARNFAMIESILSWIGRNSIKKILETKFLKEFKSLKMDALG